VIAAASIGNALEWYDILIYGYFAVTMSRLFFPTVDQSVSLLLALGTFGVSYLVRPLGGLLKAAYSGALPALMTEIFPTQTRGTGIALSYNFGVPIFAGFAPLIATWLIAATGSNLAPSFYLIVTSLLSLAVLIVIRAKLKLG
jgi:MHS family proline/betaine transporter-like MFS transporter